MRDTDYAYAVARIRANETKLLTRQDFDTLLRSESCGQCLARLADKGWGSPEQSESELLEAETAKTWQLVDEVVPDAHAFDSLKIPNDYHNLKAALKARLAQTEWDSLCMYPVTVEVDLIREAVDTKNFGLLPDTMAEAAEDAYEALVSWVDGQRCEMIVDAAALKAAIEAAKPHGGLLLELAELNAYRADIRVAVRCARMKKPKNIIEPALAECSAIDREKLADAAAQGEAAVCDYLAQVDKDGAEALRKSLSAFEKYCGEKLEKRLELAKYDPLGQAPIAAYVCARTEEIRKARLILAGLRNNVPAERIRELL